MARALRDGPRTVLVLSEAEVRAVIAALASETNAHEQGDRDYMDQRVARAEHDAQMRVWTAITQAQ